MFIPARSAGCSSASGVLVEERVGHDHARAGCRERHHVVVRPVGVVDHRRGERLPAGVRGLLRGEVAATGHPGEPQEDARLDVVREGPRLEDEAPSVPLVQRSPGPPPCGQLTRMAMLTEMPVAQVSLNELSRARRSFRLT